MRQLEHEAYVVAMKFHGDQMYGDKPYEVHLQAVRDVLVEFGYKDEEMLAAAWLHDILEDTDYPVKDLAFKFGGDVTAMVWAVSGFGPNRSARAMDAYVKIRMQSKAATLKAADRIANMRASKGTNLEQMYLKAWPDFNKWIGWLIPNAMRVELEKLHNT